MFLIQKKILVGPGLPKTNWTEMCVSNVLFIAYDSVEYVQLSTKNAYLKGTCTPEQSAYITRTWPDSTQLLPANTILDSAAVNGGNTNVVTLPNGDTVNLVIYVFITLHWQHSIFVFQIMK